MNHRFLTLTMVCSVLALTACGDDSNTGRAATGRAATGSAANGSLVIANNGPATTTPAAAEIATVTIERSRFETKELRVSVGTTVVWTNNDEFAHTVTSSDADLNDFDSGELLQGETFEMTFDEPGEFNYFCEIHPTMRAVIIVE